jgi:hypothetical protein
MSVTDLSDIALLRDKWHVIRKERLELKKRLMTTGSTLVQIRSDREYKKLCKAQRSLSTMLRHKNAVKSRKLSKKTENPNG